jgi:hypothetical protein
MLLDEWYFGAPALSGALSRRALNWRRVRPSRGRRAGARVAVVQWGTRAMHGVDEKSSGALSLLADAWDLAVGHQGGGGTGDTRASTTDHAWGAHGARLPDWYDDGEDCVDTFNAIVFFMDKGFFAASVSPGQFAVRMFAKFILRELKSRYVEGISTHLESLDRFDRAFESDAPSSVRLITLLKTSFDAVLSRTLAASSTGALLFRNLCITFLHRAVGHVCGSTSRIAASSSTGLF